MSMLQGRSVSSRQAYATRDGEAPTSFQVEKYAVVLKRWALRTVSIDVLTGDVLVDGRLAVSHEDNYDLVRCGDGVIQLDPKAQFRPSPDAPLDIGRFAGALVECGWVDVDAEAEVMAPSPPKRVLALQASTPPAHEHSPFASAPPPWATHAELVAYAKRARRDMNMILGPLAAQQRLADGGKNSGSPQRELLLHSWRPVLEQWLASGDGRGRGPPVPAPPGALEALSLGFASSLHPQRTLICNAVDRSADAENSLATNEQLEAQRVRGTGGARAGLRAPSAAARKLVVDEVDGVDRGSDDGGEAEATAAKESALVREAAAAAEAEAQARAQALTPISRRRNEFTELMRGAASSAPENVPDTSSSDARDETLPAASEDAKGGGGGGDESADEGAALAVVHVNRHGSVDVRSPSTFKVEGVRTPRTAAKAARRNEFRERMLNAGGCDGGGTREALPRAQPAGVREVHDGAAQPQLTMSPVTGGGARRGAEPAEKRALDSAFGGAPYGSPERRPQGAAALRSVAANAYWSSRVPMSGAAARRSPLRERSQLASLPDDLCSSRAAGGRGAASGGADAPAGAELSYAARYAASPPASPFSPAPPAALLRGARRGPRRRGGANAQSTSRSRVSPVASPDEGPVEWTGRRGAGAIEHDAATYTDLHHVGFQAAMDGESKGTAPDDGAERSRRGALWRAASQEKEQTARDQDEEHVRTEAQPGENLDQGGGRRRLRETESEPELQPRLRPRRRRVAKKLPVKHPVPKREWRRLGGAVALNKVEPNKGFSPSKRAAQRRERSEPPSGEAMQRRSREGAKEEVEQARSGGAIVAKMSQMEQALGSSSHRSPQPSLQRSPQPSPQRRALESASDDDVDAIENDAQGKVGGRARATVHATSPAVQGDSAPRQSKSASALGAVHRGNRVSLSDGSRGHVRYIGAVDFARGEWVGVEIDYPIGRNAGAVDGVRYFHCTANEGLSIELKYGLFVRARNASVVSPARERGRSRPAVTAAAAAPPSPRSPRSYSPSAAPLQRGAVRSGPRASARRAATSALDVGDGGRVHVDRHGRVTVGGRPIEGVGNVHIDRDGVASVLGESGSSPRSPLSVRSRSHRIGRESPRASWSPSVRAPWRSPTSAALVSGSASAVRRRRDFSEERVEQRPLDVSFDLDEQHSAGVPPAALHTHLTAMVRKLRSEQRVQMTELKSAIKRLEFRHSRGVAASELAGEYARLIAIAGDDHVAQQLTDDHPMTVRAQRRAIRRADYNASSGSSGTLAARSSRDGARDDSDADSPADWGQLGAHPMELPVKRPSPTLLNSRQRSTRDRAAAPRAPQPLPRDALRVERAKMARTDGIAARRSNGNGGAVAFAPTVGGAGQRPSQPPALGGHLQTPSAPRRRPPARPGRPAPGAVARGPLSSQRRVLRPTQRATCNDAAVLQPPALSTPTARTAAVRARKAATAASAGLHVPVQATPGVTAATTLRALSVLQETAQSLTHELTADAGLSPTQRRTLTLALETTQRRQSELLTAADLAGVMLGVAKGALRRSNATRHGGDAAAPGQAAPTPITLKRAAASASTPKELTSWLGEASPAREAQRDAYRNIGSDAGSFVVAAPHNVPVVPDARLTARTDRLERELAVLREQSAAMAEQLRATAPAAPSTPQMLSSWLDTVGTTATGTTVEDRGANSTRAAIATPTAAQPAAADMDVPAPAARAPAPAVAVKEDTVVSGGKFGRKHAVSLQDDVSASSGASREAPSAPPAEPLPELEPPSGGLEPLTAPSSPPRSPPRHSKHSIDLIEEGRLPPIATLRSSSDVGAVRWVEAFIVAGWAQYGVASALKVVRPIAFRAAISEGSSTNARASTRPHTRARTITPSDSPCESTCDSTSPFTLGFTRNVCWRSPTPFYCPPLFLFLSPRSAPAGETRILTRPRLRRCRTGRQTITSSARAHSRCSSSTPTTITRRSGPPARTACCVRMGPFPSRDGASRAACNQSTARRRSAARV